jgi:hypothetical protein
LLCKNIIVCCDIQGIENRKQTGKTFYERLRLKKGCFATGGGGGDDGGDDENYITILYPDTVRPTAV